MILSAVSQEFNTNCYVFYRHSTMRRKQKQRMTKQSLLADLDCFRPVLGRNVTTTIAGGTRRSQNTVSWGGITQQESKGQTWYG